MSMCEANVSTFGPEPGPVLVLFKDVAERIQVTHNLFLFSWCDLAARLAMRRASAASGKL